MRCILAPRLRDLQADGWDGPRLDRVANKSGWATTAATTALGPHARHGVPSARSGCEGELSAPAGLSSLDQKGACMVSGPCTERAWLAAGHSADGVGRLRRDAASKKWE